MTGVPIQQMADRVAGLMEQRLKISGQGLEEKLRKGGKLLPRNVRAAAQRVAEASILAQNPKLLTRIDQEAVAKAYDTAVRYLTRLGAKDRRIGAVLNFAASVAFSLLIVAALVFAVLRWRGFV
jgi:hypothetical protein